jgi:hypothetical protein
MSLTSQTFHTISNCKLFYPWDDSDEAAGDDEDANPYFYCNCLTNLAMLDFLCRELDGDDLLVLPAVSFLPFAPQPNETQVLRKGLISNLLGTADPP